MHDFIVVLGIVTAIFAGLAIGILAVNILMGVLTGLMVIITSPIALAILAIVALVAIGVFLYRNWTEIWEGIKSITKTVIDAIISVFVKMGNDIKFVFNHMWLDIKWVIDKVVGGFKIAGKAIVDGIVWMANGVKKAFNAVIGFFKNVGTSIGNLMKSIVDAVSNFVGKVSTLINWVGDGIKDTFTNVKDSVVNIFTVLGEKVVGAINILKDGVKIAMTAVANVFITIWNGIVWAFESGINFIIKGLNVFIGIVDKALNAVNKIAGAIGIDSLNLGLSTISEISISRVPQLARGGMLDSGQMFEAGENGKSEMMGSFNGKTTVMPLENTSFVKAMGDAVYDAMISAQDESGGNIEVIISEDAIGNAARKSINKSNRKFGRGVITV